MAPLSLKVNGQTHPLDVDPDMPLVWALRDHLDLMGTKYSCGIGECGACTVLMDEQPERSCSISVADSQGTEILTIEGLGSPEKLHPVQQAWRDEEVAQCGYCQPAQILTAVNLLENTPRPTAAQIAAGMSDVLCRCGTYQRIKRAVARAAGEG